MEEEKKSTLETILKFRDISMRLEGKNLKITKDLIEIKKMLEEDERKKEEKKE